MHGSLRCAAYLLERHVPWDMGHVVCVPDRRRIGWWHGEVPQQGPKEGPGDGWPRVRLAINHLR